MIKNLSNRKRVRYLKFNKILFFLTIMIFLLFFSYWSVGKEKIVNYFIIFIENYSNKYQYTLKEVKIEGIEFIKVSEIQDFFSLYMNKSIFLIPIHKISSKVSKDNWVKSVKIKSDYKSTIVVLIEESKPFGIFDNAYQDLLFSNKLVVLDIIDRNKLIYNDLILFKGEEAMSNSKILIELLPNNITELINEATFISKRRWDIKLKNDITLKLPENNILDSLENYKKIYMSFSNKELSNIESIDLRMTKKAILKFKNI